MSKRFFFNAVLVFLFTLFLLSLHNLRQVVCGQMLPWKIAPRLGLGFGSELGLGLRLGGGGGGDFPAEQLSYNQDKYT